MTELINALNELGDIFPTIVDNIKLVSFLNMTEDGK